MTDFATGDNMNSKYIKGDIRGIQVDNRKKMKTQMNRRKVANYSIDMSKYILENQSFKNESVGHIRPDFKENQSTISYNQDGFSHKQPVILGGGMRFKQRAKIDNKMKGSAKNQVGKP